MDVQLYIHLIENEFGFDRHRDERRNPINFIHFSKMEEGQSNKIGFLCPILHTEKNANEIFFLNK